MNGVRLITLIAAHEALMRAWRASYTEPLPYTTQTACLEAAISLQCELEALGLVLEVKVSALAATAEVTQAVAVSS